MQADGAQQNKDGGFTSDTLLLLPVLQEEAVRREEPVQAQPHQKLLQMQRQDGKGSGLFLPRWVRWVTASTKAGPTMLCSVFLSLFNLVLVPYKLEGNGAYTRSVSKRTVRLERSDILKCNALLNAFTS